MPYKNIPASKRSTEMLLFSTFLSIRESLTKDAFIRLVIEWNQKSPHPENVIPDLVWDGERNICYGTDALRLAIEEYRNRNIIAARYEKRDDDGVIWNTDFVMNFDEMKMSVCLERSYLEEALMSDYSFAAPYFIALLIDRGYLEDDGRLPVLRQPILIDEDNADLLADIIDGTTKYRLPVVYISKTSSGDDPFYVQTAANKLKGIAHVLVGKSPELDEYLGQLCDNKNETNGAVGIYYPNQILRHRRYFHRTYENSDVILSEKVISSVIRYCNSQMIDPLYTWQGVQNALLLDRLNSQRAERIAAETAAETAKEEVRSETTALLEAFDEDMQNLRKQITDLTRANEALTCENYGLRAKLEKSEHVPLICMGREEEFFPDEIKNILLSSLHSLLNTTVPGSRRYDVLKDIIDSNGGYPSGLDEKINHLKTLLKGYKNVSPSMKQELYSFGFMISEEGKHYKLTYYGDDRYGITLAKTPSDSRSGANIASTIIKNML